MLVRTLLSTVVIMAILATLLFVGAGTLDYWQAWLYLGLASVGHVIMVTDLALRDPALLARRRKGGAQAETRPVQKRLIRLLILVWAVAFAVAAWDRRFGWSHMAIGFNFFGAALYVAGQTLMMWVFRANSFARATIEVSEGQPIIDTGPTHWSATRCTRRSSCWRSPSR